MVEVAPSIMDQSWLWDCQITVKKAHLNTGGEFLEKYLLLWIDLRFLLKWHSTEKCSIKVLVIFH